MAGATSDQLTVANTKASESGDQYRAVFANVAGKAISEAATLTVATSRFDAVGWGANEHGQLGDASTSESALPVTVSGLNFVTSVQPAGATAWRCSPMGRPWRGVRTPQGSSATPPTR